MKLKRGRIISCRTKNTRSKKGLSKRNQRIVISITEIKKSDNVSRRCIE